LTSEARLPTYIFILNSFKLNFNKLYPATDNE
jgi:hypothetical protein